MLKVATRFAFSPIVTSNIGNVQTAIFNWLYSKNKNGTFHLRIKDYINKGKKKLIALQIP